MADSQVPFHYGTTHTQALRLSMSEPRFSTYLSRAGGDTSYAFALYLYNSRLAKAFLYPLGMMEVTVRNAVDRALTAIYGSDWHADPTFRQTVLTSAGLETLDTAMSRAGTNAAHCDVVSTLTFDFWSNMFRPEYGALWRTELTVVMPNLPVGLSREDVQQAVREINQLRNRVAHHEPIVDLNLNSLHAKIITVIGYCCKTTAAWVRHHSTIASATRSRPSRVGGNSFNFASRMDADCTFVAATMSLASVLATADSLHPAIICVDPGGGLVAALTMIDISRYISQTAARTHGMIDLNDSTLGDVVAALPPTSWGVLDRSAPLMDVIAELQKPQIRVLVAIDPTNGLPEGAIVRAHRRY